MNLDRPQPPPVLLGRVAKSDARCNFYDGPIQCLNLARVHYMWTDGSTSNACYRHANDVERDHSYADKHLHGPGCTVYGSRWCNSLVDPPGRCEPAGDDLEKEARADRELVGTVRA